MGCASSSSEKYEVKDNGHSDDIGEAKASEEPGHKALEAQEELRSKSSEAAPKRSSTEKRKKSPDVSGSGPVIPSAPATTAMPVEESPPVEPSSSSPEVHPLEVYLRALTAETGASLSPADLEIIAPVLAGDDAALCPANNTDSIWHAAAAKGTIHLLNALQRYCTQSWAKLQVIAKEVAAAAPVGEGEQPEVVPSSPEEFMRLMLVRLNAKVQTPLMLACINGRLHSVDFLLKHGVDVWQIARGQRTALHYAALAGHTKCCSSLLESLKERGLPLEKNGVKYVDAQAQGGATALHYAVASKQTAVVKLLLANDADIRIMATSGASNTYIDKAAGAPLHIAALLGSKEISYLLLEYASKQMARAANGSGMYEDPREVMNGASRLPCKLAERYKHQQLAILLTPGVEMATAMENFVHHLAGKEVPSLSPLSASNSGRLSQPGSHANSMANMTNMPRAPFKLNPIDSNGHRIVDEGKQLSIKNSKGKFVTAVDAVLQEQDGQSGSDYDSESESDVTDDECLSDGSVDSDFEGSGRPNEELPSLPESEAIRHQAAPRAPAAITGISSGVHFTPPPRRRRKHRSSLRRKAMRTAAKKCAIDEGPGGPEDEGMGVSGPIMCQLCPNGIASVVADGCDHRMCQECAISACADNAPSGCPVCNLSETSPML